MTQINVEKIIDALSAWARSAKDEIGLAEAYVFGSLIRNNGAQFDERSDIDLVIIVPNDRKTDWDRVEWLQRLREYVPTLEMQLLTLLGRENAVEPIVSILAATSVEISADVHKDSKPNFFSANQFRSLVTGDTVLGIPGAGDVKDLASAVVECMKFAQKKRNVYLNIAPNGRSTLQNFDDADDSLPKDTMRHAAMVRELRKPSKVLDAATDVQRGLDFISHFLYEHENFNAEYEVLSTAVSVRRKARGTREALSPLHQILLAEIIFGSAVEFEIELRKNATVALKAKAGPTLHEDSTVFFSDRFAGAFPGVRSIAWFDSPSDIAERLGRLFVHPIKFSNTSPIWWWRDGNNAIDRFENLGGGIFLMNRDELRISKIAAVHGRSYYQSFVYVEVDAMEPTGLYPSTIQRITQAQAGHDRAYLYEEYGLVDGKYMITAAEKDDGAAVINGKIEDTAGRAEGRTRYVTRYNFVIAAHGSPLNVTAFDRYLEHHLDGILKGTSTLESLAEDIAKLPKRHA